MAYSKTTYNQLQLSLAYKYGEDAIPNSGTGPRNHWLNKAVQYIADRLKMQKEAPVTVTSGVGTLPTDFKAVVLVTDADNVEWVQVNKEDYNSIISPAQVFTIGGDHISGYTLKTKTDGIFTVHYYFHNEDMVNSGDICAIPDGEAVVCYAYAMLRKSETDPLDDAQSNLEEMERRIDLMTENGDLNQAALSMKTL